MKSTIRYSLFILIIICTSCAVFNFDSDNDRDYKEYYLQVYKADSLFYTGDFQSSYDILYMEFEKYKPIELARYKPYKIFVYSALKLNLNVDYKDLLKNLIAEHGYCYGNLIKDSIFKKGFKKAGLSELDCQYLRKQYLNSLNLNLREFIIKMNKRDQEVRLSGLDVKSKEIEVEKIDKQNDSLLKEIYVMYGFPNSETIGGSSIDCNNSFQNTDTSILYNHISYNGDYQFHKSKLVEYVKDGKCDPAVLGHMIDRRNQVLGDKPIYYLFFNKYFKNDSIKHKEINSLRKAAGLPSLEQEEFWYNRF